MVRNYSHILPKHAQEHQGSERCGWEENNKSSLLKFFELLQFGPDQSSRTQ